MAERVLIVEDDPDIGSLLQMHVRALGVEARLESDGTRGLLLAQQARWDLIVLDVMLPGMDGFAICRRLRSLDRSAPVILLTARTSEADRVAGLDSGADDYVAKPFSISEFLARVRAQLRRARRWQESGRDAASGPWPADRGKVTAGRLTVDADARQVHIEGRTIKLTSREFELLWHFATHPGRVFTREHLLHAVWGAGFEGYEHTVNSHINRLRAKIEVNPSQPNLIATVWGAGYRFDTSETGPTA